MKKYLLTIVSLYCLSATLVAQEELVPEEQQYSVLSTDLIIEEIGLIPESLDANVDSLLRSWHVQYFAKVEDHCHDDEGNIQFHDSIYQQRLEALPRVISLPYNKVVSDCIKLYSERRRSLVKYMLGMADYYFPIIEPILDEYNLPIELKYLAVVESALNPVAISRVGACGLWQFMLPTGKSYGLEINSLVDERRDPIKATHAACKYFRDMYAIYGDWTLVLASYNCGPGNVNKAIRRSGGKKDFWQIFPYLPRETRSYVPLFIAANYVMNYYCEHNLCPVRTSLPLATDTIMVNKLLHFEQVSDMLNIDIEQLRALNPQYKRDIIPGHTRPFVLKLPAVETYAFIDKEDTVYAHRTEELLANALPFYAADGTFTPPNTKEKITHTAKTGENLYTIADKYGITAREIRRWNGLGTNRVANGKRLTLYIDNGGIAFASATTKTEKEPASGTKASTSSSAIAAIDGYISYKVQSGDSLYSISKKYPGISAATLQKVNELPNSNIRPGQVLKIPAS